MSTRGACAPPEVSRSEPECPGLPLRQRRYNALVRNWSSLQNQNLTLLSAAIGKVTTVLLFAERRRRNLRILRSSIFVNPYSYELEKIYSPQLHGAMHFRGSGGEGTNDGTWRLDGTDARPRCSNVGFTGANANARRYNVKPCIRVPQLQQLRSPQ